MWSFIKLYIKMTPRAPFACVLGGQKNIKVVVAGF